MSTLLADIRDELIDIIKFYQTPITYVSADYDKIVLRGTKRYYVDVGIEDSFSSNYSATPSPQLSSDLSLSEKEYILVSSQIEFMKQILGDVAQILSYSTDALSVTNADKPYLHLRTDILALELRLSELFYKITSGVGTVSTDES